MSKFRGITRTTDSNRLIYWGSMKGWLDGDDVSYPKFKGRWLRVALDEDVIIPGEFL